MIYVLRKNFALNETRLLFIAIISLFNISFSSAQSQSPDYFKMGCIAQDKANLDLAIKYYTKKIAQDPKFTKAYINRGLCYQDKADFDFALNDFKKALELKPGDPPILMSLGTVYFHQKKFKEALENLEAGLQKAPNNVKAQYDLGMAKSELKDYSGAIEAFNVAIKMDPKNEKFYYSRALSKDMMRDYKGALVDCSKAITLKPDYEKAYFLRAKEENEIHLYKEALADLDIVIKISPGNTRYYAEKGDIEYHIGLLNQSINDCDKAIEINNLYGNPFYTRALSERDSGMMDSARKDISMANDLFKGKSLLCWVESAKIKMYTGDYKGMYEDCSAALKISANYSYANYQQAYALAYMGNDSGATRVLTELLRNDNTFAMGYLLLGRLQLKDPTLYNLAKQTFEMGIKVRTDSTASALCFAFINMEARAENILNKEIAHFEETGQRIKRRDAFADLAFIYAIAKDKPKFYKFISTALAEGYANKSWIENSPELDYLRKEPEYMDLAVKYILKR